MKVVTVARVRVVLLAGLVLSLQGCKEEPKPAPPPTPTVVEKPKPPAPPPAVEQRAEKECAAPIELAAAQPLDLAGRKASLTGYKLSFADKDPDKLVFGVLGAINEDSGANLLNLKKYLKFFADQKVDAIVVTGDVGETADGIKRAIAALAESKLPVLVIAGNRECRADFTDGVNAARAQFPNVVNMNMVRAVEFPEATLISLPGYHDPEYITCATGCRYYKANVDEVIRLAKEAKSTPFLVAHGPPRGEGSQALDFAVSGGNVGDPEVGRAIREGNFSFGFFPNIKEAGGRATDLAGSTVVKEGVLAKTLFLNPGPADSVGWEMNDGTKSSGFAATVTVNQGEASWKLFRAKPLTAAEKAEAKKLDPPPRPEPTEGTEAPPTPTPPPGAPTPAADAG